MIRNGPGLKPKIRPQKWAGYSAGIPTRIDRHVCHRIIFVKCLFPFIKVAFVPRIAKRAIGAANPIVALDVSLVGGSSGVKVSPAMKPIMFRREGIIDHAPHRLWIGTVEPTDQYHLAI